MFSFVDAENEGTSIWGGDEAILTFGVSGTSSGIDCMSCLELGPLRRGLREARGRFSLSGDGGRSIRSMPFESFPGRLSTVPKRRRPPNPLFFGGGGAYPESANSLASKVTFIMLYPLNC